MATQAALDTKLTAPLTAFFSQAGSATVGSSGSWVTPRAGTVTRVVLSCIGAPSGSSLSVDFKHNGITFATLSIASGASAPVTAAVSETFALNAQMWVTATSVGSTTAATEVVAQMDWA